MKMNKFDSVKIYAKNVINVLLAPLITSIIQLWNYAEINL
jgi:hypothetical protein